MHLNTFLVQDFSSVCTYVVGLLIRENFTQITTLFLVVADSHRFMSNLSVVSTLKVEFKYSSIFKNVFSKKYFVLKKFLFLKIYFFYQKRFLAKNKLSKKQYLLYQTPLILLQAYYPLISISWHPHSALCPLVSISWYPHAA